jgi:hypothetical protein
MTNKVPRMTDRIRANLHLNGWILKSISSDPPRTKVIYILQTKVNGWIPSIVAKKYLIKRPLVIYAIDRYLQKNGPPPMVSLSDSGPSRGTSVGSTSVHSNIGNVNSSSAYNNTRNVNSSSAHNNTRNVNLSSAHNKTRNVISSSAHNSTRNVNSSSSSAHNGTGNDNSPDHNDASENKQNKPITTQHSPQSGKLSMQDTAREHPVHSSEEINKEPSSPLPSSPSPLSPLTTSPLSALSTSPLSPLSPSFPSFPSPPSPSPSSPKQQTAPKLKPVEDQLTNPITLAQASSTKSIHLPPPVIPAQSPAITFVPPPPPQLKPKPNPQLTKKKHRHTVSLERAVTMFKDNAKTLDGWNFYTENKDIKIYVKDIEGRTNPAIRGEYTFVGNHTAEDLLSVAKNTSLRKTCK